MRKNPFQLVPRFSGTRVSVMPLAPGSRRGRAVSGVTTAGSTYGGGSGGGGDGGGGLRCRSPSCGTRTTGRGAAPSAHSSSPAPVIRATSTVTVYTPAGTEREVTGGPPAVGVGKQLLLYGGESPLSDCNRCRTRARTLTVRAYRVGQGGEGGQFAVGVLEQADRPLAHRDGGERLGPGVAFAGVYAAGDDREDGVP